MIERWVRFWDRREAPTSLALTRILVGTVLLVDLLQAKYAGAVELIWSAPPSGTAWGAAVDPQLLAVRCFGASAQSAELLWALSVTCTVLFVFGALYRVSALLLAVVLAQLNRLQPDVDAIDQLLLIVVPILALSGANATWSVDAWLRQKLGKPRRGNVPAWPRYLLILQLCWMYFSAAHNRGDSAWYPQGGFSAVANILGDPHFARFMPGTFRSLYPLTQLGTAITMLFEGSAPLMLLWLWLDGPAAGGRKERGGKLGQVTRKWHVRWVWMALGALLHLGIALTMQLGIFPFAMLALYPSFLQPEELAKAAKLSRAAPLFS